MFGDKSASASISVIEGTTRFSYKCLVENIIILSNHLSRLGFSEGDRVSLFFENSFNYVVSYYALNVNGLVIVPIDVNSSNQTISYIMHDSQARCIVTDSAHGPKLRKIDSTFSLLILNPDSSIKEEIITQSFPSEYNNYEEPLRKISLLVYTTGTTGLKKGVILTNRSVINATGAIIKTMQISKRPTEIISMPITRSFALARMRFVFQLHGTVVFSRGLTNPALFIKTIIDYDVNGFGMVPSGIRILVNRFSEHLQKLTHQLDYIEMGSSSFRTGEKIELQNLLHSTKIMMHYGLTEASRSTFLDFNDRDNLRSVGKPTPGVEIAIVDDESNKLEQGKEGLIAISSDWTFEGYWGSHFDDNKNDDYFITDDVGKLDKRNYLHFISRKTDIINKGGYKFSPIEIESVLNQHNCIKESCIISSVNQESEIIALLHLDSRYDFKPKALVNFCREKLENYKVPNHFVEVACIDKTESGKIRRKVMKGKYGI